MLEINLLPWREYAIHQKKRRERIHLGSAFISSCLLLFSVHLILCHETNLLNYTITDSQIRLDHINKNLEKVKDLYKTIDFQKPPGIDLNALLSQQRHVITVLQKITLWIPPSVYAQQIRFEKNVWSMEGESTALHSIFKFSHQSHASSLNIKQKNGIFNFQAHFESLL